MAVDAPYRQIRELHEDDTGVELQLENAIDVRAHGIDGAVDDGVVTPQERQMLRRYLDIVRSHASKSLAYNRRINSLYCAQGAGLDPAGEEAKRRLRWLREPEDLVA